jgi:hypothetical protein
LSLIKRLPGHINADRSLYGKIIMCASFIIIFLIRDDPGIKIANRGIDLASAD